MSKLTKFNDAALSTAAQNDIQGAWFLGSLFTWKYDLLTSFLGGGCNTGCNTGCNYNYDNCYTGCNTGCNTGYSNYCW